MKKYTIEIDVTGTYYATIYADSEEEAMEEAREEAMDSKVIDLKIWSDDASITETESLDDDE